MTIARNALSLVTLATFSYVLAVFAVPSTRVPSRLLSDDDICLDSVPFPISTVCFGDWPIGDAHFGDYRQCRVACQFSEPDEDFFQVTHYATTTGCPFCETDDVKTYVTPSDSGLDICVPRGRCINECGAERPGCVYTGSCASQICLLGLDDSPSEKKRVTHLGPGSIFRIDSVPGEENGTLISTLDDDPRDMPRAIQGGNDRCPMRDVSFFVTASCSANNDGPFGDGREGGGGQCRSACKLFNRRGYEVVRIYHECNFCDSHDADEFFSNNTGENRICIPRERCVEECGPEGPGCAYTGSCQSQICFSGIDSKKPAEFPTFTNDGSVVVMTVDNSGQPIAIDPPVFANNAVNIQPPVSDVSSSPSSTTLPGEGSNTSSPSPTISTPPVISAQLSAAPVPTPSGSNYTVGNAPISTESSPSPVYPLPAEDIREGEKATWWVGPVIAIIGGAILASIVLTAFLVGRSSRGTNQPNPIS